MSRSTSLTAPVAHYRATVRRGVEREHTVRVRGVSELDAAVEAARVLGVREVERVAVEREVDAS